MGTVSEEDFPDKTSPSQSQTCLVCNAQIGVSSRRAIYIFSDDVTTSYRNLKFTSVLEAVLDEILLEYNIHSSIICKKCCNLLNDIDSLEYHLSLSKKEVVDKYRKTKSTVGLGSKEIESTSDAEDSAEALSTLDLHDQDFNPDALPGRAKGRRKKGRTRGRPPTTSVSQSKIESPSATTWNSQQQIMVKVENNDINQECKIEVTSKQDAEFDDQLQDIGPIDDLLEVDGLDLVEDGTIEIAGLSFLTLNGLYGPEADTVHIEGDSAPLPEEIPSVELAEERKEQFKCRFCDSKMKILSEVRRHMEMDHPDRLFECEVCEVRLADKATLIAHLEEHVTSGVRPFPCNQCSKRYALRRQLKQHIRAHQIKTFSCARCTKKFRTEAGLLEHINIHTGNRPYSCSTCGKTFAAKHVMRSHSRIHELRQRSFLCTICNKSFFKAHHLSGHKLTHQSDKNFICDVCGKRFAQQRNLDLHKVIHTGTKNYTCQMCNKSFARKTELDDHERIHTGEKPFQCEICGATFTQRSNLQSHKKATHYLVKKYQCKICEKAFKRKRLLTYHEMSVHTGEKPFKCTKCSAAFVYPEHYKKHMRIHTGEKPYKCDLCSKAFNSRDNRNAHRYTHSDKKPYECLMCTASFMRKPMVVLHLQQHHSLVDSFESYIKMNPPSAIGDLGSESKECSAAEAGPPLKVTDDRGYESEIPAAVTFFRSAASPESDMRAGPSVQLDDSSRYILAKTDDGIAQFIAQIIEVKQQDKDCIAAAPADAAYKLALPVAGGDATGGSSLQPIQLALDSFKSPQVIFATADASVGQAFQTGNNGIVRRVNGVTPDSGIQRAWPQMLYSGNSPEFLNS